MYAQIKFVMDALFVVRYIKVIIYSENPFRQPSHVVKINMTISVTNRWRSKVHTMRIISLLGGRLVVDFGENISPLL